MKKCLRNLIVVAGSVAVLLLLLLGTWLWITHQSHPKTSGKLTIEGLTAPVEILRDKYGVPHIYARTSEDLMFAEGFVHAQDRFWQMEFQRRLGFGRLSELFGKKLLETDIFLRTMGFGHVARQQVAATDPGTLGLLKAYAAGVNAYILDRRPARLGLEFALLKLQGVDFEIEPWKPVDSVVWGKMMAYDLGNNYTVERLNLDVLRTVGLSGWADFFSEYRPDMPFIISDEELPQLAAGQQKTSTPLRVFGNSGIGSNNWVISGSRTESGKPLLANDMHLSMQMPSIWYEIGLHGITEDGQTGRTEDCPFDLRGYSFPGTFGVVAGHNDRIAWGHTNLYGDVQDLFIEQINPENPDQYRVNSDWTEMEIRYEEIKIHKEEEPYILRARSTRHGPIITDLKSWGQLNTFYQLPDTEGEFPDNVGFTVLSLRWTALEVGRLEKSILMLDQASNFDEFREALRYWDVPAQNIVYADVDGNIGYQSPGRFPIRARGSGLAPVPGWTDAYEWLGYVPFEQLPYVYNPSKGYIVTANNPVTSPNYPHPAGSSYDYGLRARRITDMIEADTDGISAADTAAMHSDTFDQSAFEIVPYLRGLDLAEVESEEPDRDLSERKLKKKQQQRQEQLDMMNAARDSLLAWNKRMDLDSAEAVLYGYFWIKLIEETFEDQYPQNRWPPKGTRRIKNAMYYLLDEPDNPFWDDIRTPDQRENRDEILAEAFRKGYREAVDQLGDKMDSWRWGAVHTATFRNATFGQSGIKPIEMIFNRGPVETSGGADKVNVTGWWIEDPFNVQLISSQRAIYDLSDLGASLMIHPTGQSGHPTHRHYDDYIEPWRKVEYHPSHWEREAVEKAVRGRLLLRPAGEAK